MARYFFSIRVRDRVLPDREGVDLPDGADPKACALYLARKLRLDREIASDLAGCFVEVTDCGGAYVALVAVPNSEDSPHG